MIEIARLRPGLMGGVAMDWMLEDPARDVETAEERADRYIEAGRRALPGDAELAGLALDVLLHEDRDLWCRVESCRAETGGAVVVVWVVDAEDVPVRVRLTGDREGWADQVRAGLSCPDVLGWMRLRLSRPWEGQQYGDEWVEDAEGPWYLSSWDDPACWGADVGGLTCVVLPESVAYATDDPINDAPLDGDIDTSYYGWRRVQKSA